MCFLCVAKVFNCLQTKKFSFELKMFKFGTNDNILTVCVEKIFMFGN